MTRTVDLVADLGEGFGAYRMGDDNALLDVLTSANVACGFHAGDPRIMDATVAACVQRGIAVGIVASGNYLSGAVWPPFLQYAVDEWGWRSTYLGIGLFCLVTMLPLAFALRERAHLDHATAPVNGKPVPALPPKAPPYLQWVLIFAGLSCCIAMSMPQVHIVAYCGDLGYGTARGAEMLSIILGMGVVSRLISGLIADRIGYGAGAKQTMTADRCAEIIIDAMRWKKREAVITMGAKLLLWGNRLLPGLLDWVLRQHVSRQKGKP